LVDGLHLLLQVDYTLDSAKLRVGLGTRESRHEKHIQSSLVVAWPSQDSKIALVADLRLVRRKGLVMQLGKLAGHVAHRSSTGEGLLLAAELGRWHAEVVVDLYYCRVWQVLR
jgi:hypothetical protein